MFDSIDWKILQQDWLYGALGLIWALGYGTFELIKQQKLRVRQEQELLEEQIRQNDIRLKSELRSAKIHLAAFEGDSKDILHDAFWYHSQRGTDIRKSIWIGELNYIFSTHKQRAYLTAYEKFKVEDRLSQDFVKFVEELISTTPEPT